MGRPREDENTGMKAFVYRKHDNHKVAILSRVTNAISLPENVLLLTQSDGSETYWDTNTMKVTLYQN